jgi:uncharacterized protein
VGLKEWIIPQDKVFYDLLEKESANVLVGARKLEDAIRRFDDLESRRKELKDIEHAGDRIVREIYEKINESFITPIDREDIAKLASLYDDVLDLCYSVINRIFLFEIEEPTRGMVRFAELVRESVDEIELIFVSIRRMNKDEIDKRLARVDWLESEADSLLNEEIAALFREGDVLRILKLKEVYEYLEMVTDSCEDVALALRDMMLKHS